MIEFGRLRFPPARRDVFGGDRDGLEAGVREGERRNGRTQGLETDVLQGVGEEPALELDPVFRAAFAGLEFVQGDLGAVDEDKPSSKKAVSTLTHFTKLTVGLHIFDSSAASVHGFYFSKAPPLSSMIISSPDWTSPAIISV